MEKKTNCKANQEPNRNKTEINEQKKNEKSDFPKEFEITESEFMQLNSNFGENLVSAQNERLEGFSNIKSLNRLNCAQRKSANKSGSSRFSRKKCNVVLICQDEQISNKSQKDQNAGDQLRQESQSNKENSRNSVMQSPLPGGASSINSRSARSSRMLQFEENSDNRSQSLRNLNSPHRNRISGTSQPSRRRARGSAVEPRPRGHVDEETVDLSARLEEAQNEVWAADEQFFNMTNRPKSLPYTKKRAFRFFERRQSVGRSEKCAKEDRIAKKVFLYDPDRPGRAAEETVELDKSKYARAIDGLSTYFGCDSHLFKKFGKCYDSVALNLWKRSAERCEQTLMTRLELGENYRILANYPLQRSLLWAAFDKEEDFLPEQVSTPFCYSILPTQSMDLNLMKNSKSIFLYICKVSRMVFPEKFEEMVFLTVEFLRTFLRGSVSGG